VKLATKKGALVTSTIKDKEILNVKSLTNKKIPPQKVANKLYI